jgi:hypothetical protein
MKRIIGAFESAKWNLGEKERLRRERFQYEARATAIAKDLRRNFRNQQARRIAAREYVKVIGDEAEMLSNWDPVGIRDSLMADFQPQQIDQYFENPSRNTITDNYDINQRIWALRENSGSTHRAGHQEARDILDHEIFAGRVQPSNAPNAGTPLTTSNWDPANHA